jgi:hypothetical protein
MNEIEVPLKITGIAEIKKQLKEVRNALASATDPKEMERLAQAAGELKDQLADVNEKVSVFASGSKFEQTSNAFGLMQSQLSSLDFEGAAESAKLFTSSLKNINPTEFATQFKGFGQVMLSLGSAVGVAMKQFIAFGVSLLANPIFLLVAVIVAIVAAFLLWLNKIGVLKKVLDTLMIPINALIQGFKDLTDWLGLTSYAAEENAAKMIEANDKIVESSKDRQAALGASYDFEIKMAKIAGQETLGLELEKSRSLQGESKKRLSSAQDALKAQLKLGEDGDKEVIKKLKAQIKEERGLILEQVRDRKLIVAQNQVDKQAEIDKELEKQKENAEKIAKANKDAAEKARAAAKKFAEDRLAAQRTIADIEISLIKNDSEREIATINEKYIRQMQDLQKNENLTAQEKARLAELYNQQLQTELNKQEQTVIDAEKAKQQKVLDLIKANQEAQQQAEEDYYEQYRLQVMSAQEKEIDAVTSKYFQLIAKAEQFGLDTKVLKEQQEKELADINKKYADQQAKDALDAENKKRTAQLDTVNGALKLAEDSTKSIQSVGDIAFAAKMAKVKKGSKEEEELAKKQFKFNKAMQLSGAIIDAGKAITASLAASPLTILGVPSPGGIAALVATAATSAANIAKIASTQFTSTNAPGGNAPNIPTASSSSTTGSATPAFNLFGGGNNMNNVGADGQTQQTEITVKAVVSETEITNTQNKVTKINKNATL